MEATQTVDPTVLASYEGLVIKTASRNARFLKSMEFEDICQVIRVKVWKSLLLWDPTEPRTKAKIRRGASEDKLRDGYVFGNVRNLVKDLLKMNSREMKALLIEDIAPDNSAVRGGGNRDRFEEQYLSTDAEEVFQAVEETDPLIPSTLNHNERLVLACMYLGYNGPETAQRLAMDRRKVATATRNIRRKMADWKPSAESTPASSAAALTV